MQAHRTQNDTFFWRGTASYITGAHAFKTGFNYGWGFQDRTDFSPDAPMQFRFNNGVPNQLTLHARPFRNITHIRDHGLFVQDRWTVNRLTLTAGLRYDYFHDFFPETPIGPADYAPNRNIVFPKTDGVTWHDIQPRSGFAYDVFGDGRTAVKVSLNKYMAGQAAIGIFAFDMAPANRLVNTTNRSWNDANRDFVPDCDLVSPVANGECGAMSNPDFGTTRSGIIYDPETLNGWGKRDHNWQFTRWCAARDPAANVDRGQLLPDLVREFHRHRTTARSAPLISTHSASRRLPTLGCRTAATTRSPACTTARLRRSGDGPTSS